MAGKLCGRWQTEVPVDPRHAWIHYLNVRISESSSTVSKGTVPTCPPVSQIALDPSENVRILLNPHGYSEEAEVAAMDFPSPPVPANLWEMLKDYLEHIEQLQTALISVSHGRQSYAPRFEAAVWLLEDCLTGFVAEARAELATAEASGDPKAIAQSQRKEKLRPLRDPATLAWPDSAISGSTSSFIQEAPSGTFR